MKSLKTSQLSLDVWQTFIQSEERLKFEYFQDMNLDSIENKRLEGLWLAEKLIGLALLHPNQDLTYQTEIKDYCICRYGGKGNCSELFEYLNEIFPLYQSGMTLEIFSIHEDFQDSGYGSWWVKQLKERYPSLLLYAGIATEEFWERQGFDSLVLDYYVYPFVEDLIDY